MLYDPVELETKIQKPENVFDRGSVEVLSLLRTSISHRCRHPPKRRRLRKACANYTPRNDHGTPKRGMQGCVAPIWPGAYTDYCPLCKVLFWSACKLGEGFRELSQPQPKYCCMASLIARCLSVSLEIGVPFLCKAFHWR